MPLKSRTTDKPTSSSPANSERTCRAVRGQGEIKKRCYRVMSNRLRCRLVSSLLAAAVLVWYAGRRYSDPPWNCDASSPVGARHGDRMGDQFFRHLACRVLDRSAVRPRSIQSFHRYFVDWNKSDSDPLASDSACRIGDGHSSGRGPTFPFAECTGGEDPKEALPGT